MSTQIPFGADSFADNPEPRAPCVLLLDTSRSMEGERIAQLNEGLLALKEHLEADDLARKRVELAIVTFGAALPRALPLAVRLPLPGVPLQPRRGSLLAQSDCTGRLGQHLREAAGCGS